MPENYLWKVITSSRFSATTPEISPDYQLYYPLDGTVEAKPNSLGIFCFRTRSYARKFVEDFGKNKEGKYKIVKVKPLTDPVFTEEIPTLMSSLIVKDYIRYFDEYPSYKRKQLAYVVRPPDGTVLVSKVLVLT